MLYIVMYMNIKAKEAPKVALTKNAIKKKKWSFEYVILKLLCDYNLIHSDPSMKLREIKGLASSSVSSLAHDTLPAKLAPGPLHLYCP